MSVLDDLREIEERAKDLYFADLEEEQVFPTLLFNPFHDEVGRFTTSSGGAGTFSDAYKSSKKRLSHVPDDMEYIEFDSEEEAIAELGEFGKSGIAAYANGKVYVTPGGKKYFSDNPDIAKYAMTHEVVHGRTRSGGGILQPRSRSQMEFEEGSTDLISIALSGKRSTMSYKKYGAGVANMARSVSKGNRKKAWEWISRKHYENDDWQNTPKIPNGSDDDLNWLFSQMPKKLEDTDLNPWLDSERAKWEHMYGQGNPEF